MRFNVPHEENSVANDVIDAGYSPAMSDISQHLGILKACGMINARRDGTKMFYAIEDTRILRMITLTREIFCTI